MGGKMVLPAGGATQTREERAPDPVSPPRDLRILEQARAIISDPRILSPRRRHPTIPLWVRIMILVATVTALLVLFPPGAD